MKEKVAKQLTAVQKLLKASEEKVAKLEKAEETRKAKAKLKQENRENTYTTHLAFYTKPNEFFLTQTFWTQLV